MLSIALPCFVLSGQRGVALYDVDAYIKAIFANLPRWKGIEKIQIPGFHICGCECSVALPRGAVG